jgi:hypothetical protein
VNVRASECTPSLLALMHSNMLQCAVSAIEGGEKRKEKEKEKEKERKKTGNSDKNDTNISSTNNIYNNWSSNESSSTLFQMLTSSSFSSQDAHSLPPEIQEVSFSKSRKLILILFKKNFNTYFIFLFILFKKSFNLLLTDKAGFIISIVNQILFKLFLITFYFFYFFYFCLSLHRLFLLALNWSRN